MLDSELVVLDGFLGTLALRLPQLFYAHIAAQSPTCPIVTAQFREANVTMGAAQMIFAELLDNPGQVAQRFAQPPDDSQHWSRQRINPAVFKG